MKNGGTYDFFRKILLHWDRQDNFRTMPWKKEKNPYKIWLSEIILQQTRVEQGLSYYNSFIKRFPTVKQLAAADESVVFKLWEGLGYYSRCRNLIHTARYISIELKGQFPDNYDSLLRLKGVGPYTAAAIASFAFGEVRAVVDGNVIRVLSRVFGINEPWDTSSGRKKFETLATQLIDSQHPGTYNQAIMDFGATICKPKSPNCEACPFQRKCTAFLNGTVNLLPIKSKKIQIRERWFYYFVCRYQDGYYIQKRTAKDIWLGLHEFILVETKKKTALSKVFDNSILKVIPSVTLKKAEISEIFSQKLTHQTIHGRFVTLRLNKSIQSKDWQYVKTSELVEYSFPKLINSYLQQNPLP